MGESAKVTNFGAGNVVDKFNEEGYRCTEDYGFWVYNAGVVQPGVSGCTTDNKPVGTITKRFPQVTGPAAEKPFASHRWWGSVSFLGEMTLQDPDSAAYITPDPIIARISQSGVRVMGIPSGLQSMDEINFQYPIPDPFAEVFDGIAVANSMHFNLEGYLKESSDGSMTIEWQASGNPVMEATFLHGSPYVFFKTYEGDFVIKTLREDGGEKGTFSTGDNSLGLWTRVAGNKNTYLLIGDEGTTFSGATSNSITINSQTNEFTLALLPPSNLDTPTQGTVDEFKLYARNVVSKVDITYQIESESQAVNITHHYLDQSGEPLDTMMGLHPLHWKNAGDIISTQSVRSARGTVKFLPGQDFSYQIPSVGVLPFLPTIDGSIDRAVLTQLVNDFIAQGQDNWNTFTDTYWSGKAYSKVAELAAIARSAGLDQQADVFINWLKLELADWFTAATGDTFDEDKYFVYDEDWDTLLGVSESFLSHQMLNDHHFHYGYFVRAAAEICRVDLAWCSEAQYGPMIELLIRDYAGGRDDEMFPYLRHFDPANGFSWASGMVNFARGNNNESTSEAANAYGAITLYGLITGQQDLVDRGTYLHASTAATYWQYWNNIDHYQGKPEEYNNFPSTYDKITTSIIWGDGAVFSTWFSPRYAHILGIQGLPINPLTLHVGQYPDYMRDYIELGMSESENGKPSGLDEDQWRDVWWNLWATNDAQAALDDYESMADYVPEFGETKAHTYHWIHTFTQLGNMLTGNGDVTADDPASMVFEKDDNRTYLSYNFSEQEKTVNFSDGVSLLVQPGVMTRVTTQELELDDQLPPEFAGDVMVSNVRRTSVDLGWDPATDNVRVASYEIQIQQNGVTVQTVVSTSTSNQVQGLSDNTAYSVIVTALDVAGNRSNSIEAEVTTADLNADLPPQMQGVLAVENITATQATVRWQAAEDEGSINSYNVVLSGPDNFEVVTSVNRLETTLSGLSEQTTYTISISALDDSSQESIAITTEFQTASLIAPLVLLDDQLQDGYSIGNFPGNNEADNDSITLNSGTLEADFSMTGNVYLIAPVVLDLSAYEQGFLRFDLRLASLGSHTDVFVKIDSGWPNLSDVNLSDYGGLPVEGGDFQSYSIPVSDISAASNSLSPGNQVDLTSVINPFVLEGNDGGQDLHIVVESIRIE
ncbi:glucan 1,3-beta-glucanase [Aliiglaciecola sp. M165]|nr:glucan 1,3-beta-glucanase [Aliiglaciecola sp. M165]